jgi:hypothetical protein
MASLGLRQNARTGCGSDFRRSPTPTPARSMARKWRDAVSELVDLQEGYRTWLDSLPENLAESATAEALRAICDLDLSELDSVEPPPGFGRDEAAGVPPALF